MKTSVYNQKYLATKQEWLDLVDNSYLQDPKNSNFIYIKDKFFPDETVDKTQLLNVGSMLFKSIVDTTSYYVDKPDSEVDYNPFSSVINFEANGYMLLGFEMVDGELSIKNMPTKDHYYDYDLGADVIVRLYSKPETNSYSSLQYYLLHTIYYENKIENKLYKLQTTSYDSGVEVPLDTIPETAELEEIEVVPYKPLRTIKEDVRVQYPKPEVEIIKPLVYSIDRKAVMFETQFLKNTEQIILFRNIKPSNLAKAKDIKNGWVSYKQIKNDIQFTDDPNAWIEFINNMNELITEAIEYEQKQIRRISAITSVPTDFLWLESSHWVIGQWSRTILHGAFIRKIESIRSLMDPTLTEMFEIVAKNNWVKPDYSRPDVFVKDEKELVEELAIARTNNLISPLKAVMEYQGIDLEQAEKEIKLISLSTTEENANQTLNAEWGNDTASWIDIEE